MSVVRNNGNNASIASSVSYVRDNGNNGNNASSVNFVRNSSKTSTTNTLDIDWTDVAKVVHYDLSHSNIYTIRHPENHEVRLTYNKESLNISLADLLIIFKIYFQDLHKVKYSTHLTVNEAIEFFINKNTRSELVPYLVELLQLKKKYKNNRYTVEFLNRTENNRIQRYVRGMFQYNDLFPNPQKSNVINNAELANFINKNPQYNNLGGARRRKKGKENKKKKSTIVRRPASAVGKRTRKRKVHVGPRGGKYVLVKGKKRYL